MLRYPWSPVCKLIVYLYRVLMAKAEVWVTILPQSLVSTLHCRPRGNTAPTTYGSDIWVYHLPNMQQPLPSR